MHGETNSWVTLGHRRKKTPPDWRDSAAERNWLQRRPRTSRHSSHSRPGATGNGRGFLTRTLEILSPTSTKVFLKFQGQVPNSGKILNREKLSLCIHLQKPCQSPSASKKQFPNSYFNHFSTIRFPQSEMSLNLPSPLNYINWESSHRNRNLFGLLVSPKRSLAPGSVWPRS